MSYLPPPNDPFGASGSSWQPTPAAGGSSWPPADQPWSAASTGGFGAAPTPYGQAPASPAYVPAGASVDRPPTTIWVAFGLTIGAAVVLIGSAVWLALWIYELRDSAAGVTNRVLDDDPTGYSSAQVAGWADDAATSVVVAGAALYVAVAAVYVLMAFLMKSGSEAGRIVSTVLAVLSLVFLVGGPVNWLIVALGIGAVVCLWLSPSSAYIQVRKIARTGIIPGAPPAAPPPPPAGGGYGPTGGTYPF